MSALEKSPSPKRSPLITNLLSNLPLLWKIALVVFVMLLGIIGVVVAGGVGLQTMKFHISNLYEFMLIPINALDQADILLADSAYHITQIQDPSISTTARLAALENLEKNTGEILQIVEKYETDWITTLSPEFTEILQDSGKIYLQNEEIQAFNTLKQNNREYKPAVESFIAAAKTGSIDQARADELISSIEAIRVELQHLIEVNLSYGLLSNEAATTAYNRAFSTMGWVLGVALLLGMGLSYFVTTSTVSRLGSLTRSATAMQSGDLDMSTGISGRDEVGVLGEAFNTMAVQLKTVFATLEQRVTERTKALATSGEVSRRISTISDRQKLAVTVVEELQAAFNYYHAHIYLADEAGENLLMAGGTGEAGKILLEQGHSIPLGRGLVGRAAETKTTVLFADTRQAIGWLPNPLLPETKAEVAVPIMLGDQVLGVIDVQNDVVGSLSQQDADMIGAIASQVAIAVQNINQYQNTQKIANDLGVVAEVGLATATITDTDRLLQEVVDLSKKSFQLYHAHIYLLNDAGDSLVLAAGAGEVGRQMVSEGRSIPLDSEKSLVARAGRTLTGVVVNDISADPDYLPNPLLPDTRSEMAVPMVTAGKLIGVLDVQAETLNRFTETDVNIKTTLASQIAVALQNARSFARTQQLATRETTLNQISQKIQGAATIDAALQVAVRELGHALGMRPVLASIEQAEPAGKQEG